MALGGLFASVIARRRRGDGRPGASRAASGGEITIGAEQEPSCADWIDACAGETWGVWTMEEHTMPRVFDIVARRAMGLPAQCLLGRAPAFSTVGGNQVVTYQLKPKAVWSDGRPITATDFKYTWDQIAHGANIYDRTGLRPHHVHRRLQPSHRRWSPSAPRSPGGPASCSAAASAACSQPSRSPARTATPR